MLPESATLNRAGRRMIRARGRVGLSFVATLSLIAGMTDAIGFMVSGDFVSFMSGNTTRLAIAVGGGDYALSLRIGVLITAFVVGNALGVIASRAFKHRAWPLLASIGTLLCLCGWLDQGVAPLIGAVVAMGMINAVVEEVNGLPIGLTYVTGALSRFGRGLGRWLLGERRNGWRVQLVPWGGMLSGAILGGLLAHTMGLRAMLVSGIAALILACLSATIPHRWQSSFLPK